MRKTFTSHHIVSKAMQGDPSDSVDTLRERIATGERDVSPADRDILIEFSDELRLLKTEYSDYRHEKLLRHATRMAEEVGGLAEVPHDREAAERVLRWINNTYENEETNRDYRSALRVFAKRVTPGDEVPEAVEWVPTGTSRSYDPAPDPAEMLDWDEDVVPMIEAAQNSRDAALVALQFDAGLRSQELHELRVGDLSDSEHGLRVHVDGKTGERTVGLIPSVPYVTRWLDDHPSGNDTDPLWCHLAKPERLSYRRYLDVFEILASRADVDKKVTPTNFRRSNTAYLAKQGANNAMIEDRQGRERGSEHVARYLARFGSEWDEQYASMHGVEVTTDEEAIAAPIECPRCEKETSADKPTCQWCGQAIDAVAAETIDQAKTELRDLMVRADDVGTRRAANESLSRIDDDPDFAEEIVDLHQSDTSGSSSN